METPIPITAGTGSASVAADLVSGNSYQQIKVVDGTIGGNTPLKVNADGSITASIYGNITTTPPANQSVSGTVNVGGSVISFQGGTWVTSTPNQSVSGTIIASITGLTPVNITQIGGVSAPTVTNPGADNINVGTFNGLVTETFPFVYNGNGWDRLRGSSTTGLWIYGSVQGSFSPSGNQSVSGTVQTQVQGSVATVIIGGSIAASFTPPANQSVSGTVATYMASSIQTAGQDGSNQLQYSLGPSLGTAQPVGVTTYVYNGSSWDRSRGNVNIGTLVTPYAFPSSFVSGVTSVMTGTASVIVLPTPAANQRNYITNVLVTNAAAVGTTVSLTDAGNIIYTGYAAASGGGFSASFPAPLRQSSLVGSLGAISSIQASVYVSASGYTAP